MLLIRCYFAAFLLVLTIGCDIGASATNISVEKEAILFQSELDSIMLYLEDNKLALRAEALYVNDVGRDTFNVARERIPIKKIHFLVANSYDILTESLEEYDKGIISEKKLAYTLDDRRKYIDSLLWVHRIDYDF